MRSTKVLFLAAITAGATIGGTVATTARAALLAADRFDYAPGSNNGNGTATAGWAGSWGGGTVVAGSLTYSDGTNSVPQAGDATNRVFNGNGRWGRTLDTTAGGTFGSAGLVSGGYVGADNTTLYLGVLMKFDSVSSFASLELHRDVSGDGSRVVDFGRGEGYQDASTLAAFNPNGSNGDVKTFGQSDVATHLYVLRIDFKTGNDVISLYRDPVDLSVEPATPIATVSSRDVAFNRVSFGNFGNAGLSADELRIGTSFADVTAVAPVPEPASLGVAATLAAATLLRRRRTNS
jgi:hypothetical protein